MEKVTSYMPLTYVPQWSDEDHVLRLRYNQLGQSDIYASCLSFGTAQVSRGVIFNDDLNDCIHGHEEAVETIRSAVKRGINYIDTSPLYGRGMSEVVIGKALELIPREAYYLATKIGRTPNCTFDYTAENTIKSVEDSLKKLKVQYLDVIQVHDVEFADSIDIIVNETLPALHNLRQSGKVKNIGITGYSLSTLKEIVEKSDVKIDLVLSYCRCTPFDQTLQQYLPFFNEKGLGVINAALTGIGLLTNGPLPYWHPSGEEVRGACKLAADYCRDRGVNITRLSVYYALKQNGIGTHLIGMENMQTLDSNLDVALNGITDYEKLILDQIIKQIFSKVQVYHWEGVEVSRYRADKDEFCKYLRGDD